MNARYGRTKVAPEKARQVTEFNTPSKNRAPDIPKTEAKEGDILSYFDDGKGKVLTSFDGGYQSAMTAKVSDMNRVDLGFDPISIEAGKGSRISFRGVIQAGLVGQNIITITSGNKTQYIPDGTKKLYLDGSQGGEVGAFARANTACEINEIVIDDAGHFDACIVILESGGANWTFEMGTSSSQNNDLVMDSDDLFYAELSSNDMTITSGARAMFTRSSNDWKLHSLSSLDGIIMQTGTLQPITSDAYNLGASNKYWDVAYFNSIGSGKHIISTDQDIRFAHDGDNTVIVELKEPSGSSFIIPAYSIITSVTAVVKTDSNLGTHHVNIQFSGTSGTSADSSISGGTEILGAGVTNTDSTDSTSASDIDLDGTRKKVWICRDTVMNDSVQNKYIYICNAGTGNGTTNSTTGTLTVIIEYYGMD